MRNKKIQELRDVSPETTMIYRLISTNKLLSDTIYAQQKEIEMLNFRIGGFLTYFENKKKHTNKKYLRKDGNSYAHDSN